MVYGSHCLIVLKLWMTVAVTLVPVDFIQDLIEVFFRVFHVVVELVIKPEDSHPAVDGVVFVHTGLQAFNSSVDLRQLVQYLRQFRLLKDVRQERPKAAGGEDGQYNGQDMLIHDNQSLLPCTHAAHPRQPCLS